MNTKNKISPNQTSINFEEAIKLRKLQNNTNVKSRISDVLEDKNIPKFVKISIPHSENELSGVEFYNSKIRKIKFTDKFKEKIQLNLNWDEYYLEEFTNYSSNDDEITNYIAKNLKVLSYNKFLWNKSWVDIYWKTLKDSDKKYYNYAKYVVEFGPYFENELEKTA